MRLPLGPSPTCYEAESADQLTSTVVGFHTFGHTDTVSPTVVSGRPKPEVCANRLLCAAFYEGNGRHGRVERQTLVSVPFISNAGFSEATRRCVAILGATRSISSALARRQPTHIAYALWIEEHGLLRVIGHSLPFLRYMPPLQS